MKKPFWARWLARRIDSALCLLTSFITGVRPKAAQQLDFPSRQTVYYANHNSHGDFVLVWVSLPKQWRMNTRPVAGADYWLGGRIRRFIIEDVFNGLLVDRGGHQNPQQIIDAMSAALQQGESLSFQLHGPRACLQSIHGRFHAVTAGAEKEALTCGDGAFIRDETNITLVADTPLRALLIDLPV